MLTQFCGTLVHMNICYYNLGCKMIPLNDYLMLNFNHATNSKWMHTWNSFMNMKKIWINFRLSLILITLQLLLQMYLIHVSMYCLKGIQQLLIGWIVKIYFPWKPLGYLNYNRNNLCVVFKKFSASFFANLTSNIDSTEDINFRLSGIWEHLKHHLTI